jgi:hypothetical protein
MRHWAATEAEAIGYGGIMIVHRATGIARSTIGAGLIELRGDRGTDEIVKVRRKGSERRPHEVVHPELLPALQRLVDPATRGDPGSHVWKYELQRLSDKLGVAIHVSHFPPGTSKWNKVEHRLFSFITVNWRGRPLRTYETIVNLIGNTTTRSGLVVRAKIDRRRYPLGKKIPAKEMRALNIVQDTFHGDWNYTIHPRAVVFGSSSRLMCRPRRNEQSGRRGPSRTRAAPSRASGSHASRDAPRALRSDRRGAARPP